MKTTLFSLLLVFSLFVFKGFSQKGQTFVSNKIIEQFKPAAMQNLQADLTGKKFGNALLDDLNRQNGLTKISLTGNRYEKRTYVLTFDTAKDIPALVRQYTATGLFRYVEPDYIGKAHGVAFTPNDTYYYNVQWQHYNDGTFNYAPSTADADMDTDWAWEITQGSPGITVAILDSGLKLDHPEFYGRLWINPNEAEDNTDTDGNGYIDDVLGGWDFEDDDNAPWDGNGHGTNVTGIALATGNNGIGYAGVNWNSKIMVCRILDNNGYGDYIAWVDAIYYAVDNGADVINISAGGTAASTLLLDAVNYASAHDVPIVASAGNSNTGIEYPAKYIYCIAVGSTDPDDTRSAPFFWSASSGSNYGPQMDFVAPGNYIFGPSHLSNTNYDYYWGGTSQAAPQVTGVISLLLSIDPSLDVEQIMTILQDSSEDQVGDALDTPGWDQYYGYGRINAFQAVTHESIIGTTQFTQNTEIKLYPNPVSGTLHFTGNELSKLSTVRVSNTLGQEILRMPYKDEIDLSHLHPGVYFIHLTDTQNNTATYKVIKE